jgi:hypothetical protein
MTDPKDDLKELATGIARIISDNRKFLSRLMDDDFEPEEEAETSEDEDGDDLTPVG